MDDFHYENGSLYCENARLRDVAAEFGTPVYVYSRGTFNRHLSEFRTAFAPLDPQIRYAVKACGNVHLLREANALGAGADVVSGGELYRALCAGIPAERVVFAGVGKTTREMGEAIEAGVGCFNVESAAELETLNRVAAGMGRIARAAIRVNPDVSGHETPLRALDAQQAARLDWIAGMSSFMRTAVYDAFHFIWPAEPRDGLVPPRRAEELELDGLRTTDVAGPICESSDYLGRNRDLPPLSSGEVLCVFGAGAYGMTMASHYNSMPRPPEVLIDRGEARLIRRRESYADLVDAEFSLAELTEQLAEVANPSS